MSTSRPHFHLQRVLDDGTSSAPEVYRVGELPANMHTDRRGFLGVGMAASTLIASLSGCNVPNSRRPNAQPEAESSSAAPSRRPARPAQGQHVFAHRKGISALAFSSDAATLISTSWDGDAKIWSMPEGKLIRKMSGINLALSADGCCLAIVDEAGNLVVSSPPGGGEILKLAGLTTCDSLAISPDGSLVAGAFRRPGRTGGYISRVDVHDIGRSKRILSWEPHASVTSLTFAAGGSQLVTNGLGGPRIWSMPDGKLHSQVEPVGQATGVVALHEATGRLAVCGGREAYLWTFPQLRKIETFRPLGNAYIKCIAFRPDGGELFAGASSLEPGVSSGDVWCWPLPEGMPISNFFTRTNYPAALAVSANNQWLAAGYDDGVVLIWSLISRTELSYCFDPGISGVDAITYNVADATGRTLTFTMPCGSPVPPGAVCVCNCVPGSGSWSSGGGGGGSNCTCNKVCTCVPVFR